MAWKTSFVAVEPSLPPELPLSAVAVAVGTAAAVADDDANYFHCGNQLAAWHSCQVLLASLKRKFLLLQNVVVVDTTAVASLFAAVVAAKLSVVAVVVATLSAVAVVVATLFAVAVVVATPSVVAVVDTASLVVAVVATEFAVAALVVVGIEIVVLAVAFVEKLELVDNWEVPDLLEIGRSSMGSGTVVVVAWEDLWTLVEHSVETGLLHEEGEGHCPTVFDQH